MKEYTNIYVIKIYPTKLALACYITDNLNQRQGRKKNNDIIISFSNFL